MNFDHIGIFVKDIEVGLAQLKNLLPIVDQGEIYKDPLLRVLVQFCYDQDGTCYELVAPFGDDNPVDPILASNNNILNHVAYKSEHFEGTVKHFRDSGCVPLSSAKPAVAFGGARVIFFLTPLRLIVEIIEA
jgi:methylmalonyl-CoA/ethylmalonyl-CoA epimerase